MTDKTALREIVSAAFDETKPKWQYEAFDFEEFESVLVAKLAAHIDATPQAAPSLPAVDAALEMAAQICDDAQRHNQFGSGEGFKEPADCAAAIRALQSKPASTAAQEAPQLTDEQIRRLAHEHLKGTGDHCILNFARALHQRSRTKCCH